MHVAERQEPTFPTSFSGLGQEHSSRFSAPPGRARAGCSNGSSLFFILQAGPVCGGERRGNCSRFVTLRKFCVTPWCYIHSRPAPVAPIGHVMLRACLAMAYPERGSLKGWWRGQPRSLLASRAALNPVLGQWRRMPLERPIARFQCCRNALVTCGRYIHSR